MDARTSIFFFKKLAKGFRTKKDIVTKRFKNETEVEVHIENKEFGLFIISAKNSNITIDDFVDYLRTGIPDGMHGGNNDAIFDTWFDTKVGRVSVIGIPKSELLTY